VDLKGLFDLSIKVLTDWRVLACLGGVFVIWTLFRYVGVISQHRPRNYGRPAPPRRSPKEETKGGD
jgi:hypothetical protein